MSDLNFDSSAKLDAIIPKVTDSMVYLLMGSCPSSGRAQRVNSLLRAPGVFQ